MLHYSVKLGLPLPSQRADSRCCKATCLRCDLSLEQGNKVSQACHLSGL